jgi:hypothetical protein
MIPQRPAADPHLLHLAQEIMLRLARALHDLAWRWQPRHSTSKLLDTREEPSDQPRLLQLLLRPLRALPQHLTRLHELPQHLQVQQARPTSARADAPMASGASRTSLRLISGC